MGVELRGKGGLERRRGLWGRDEAFCAWGRGLLDGDSSCVRSIRSVRSLIRAEAVESLPLTTCSFVSLDTHSLLLCLPVVPCTPNFSPTG